MFDITTLILNEEDFHYHLHKLPLPYFLELFCELPNFRSVFTRTAVSLVIFSVFEWYDFSQSYSISLFQPYISFLIFFSYSYGVLLFIATWHYALHIWTLVGFFIWPIPYFLIFPNVNYACFISFLYQAFLYASCYVNLIANIWTLYARSGIW